MALDGAFDGGVGLELDVDVAAVEGVADCAQQEHEADCVGG